MISEALFLFALVTIGLAGLAVLAALVASRRALVIADAIDIVVQADLIFVIAYFDNALIVVFVLGRAAEHLTTRWYSRLGAAAPPALSILASSTQLVLVATAACLGTPTWLALAAAAAPLVRNRAARHFLEFP